MFVRSQRPLGFTYAGGSVVIEPGIRPMEVPDELKDAAGFDLATKSGDLVVVTPETLANVDAPVDTTGTKKPGEILADAKSGKAADAAKPVTQ